MVKTMGLLHALVFMKKYLKQTERLKKLAEEQQAHLDNKDIDGFMKCLEKKQKLLDKLEEIGVKINETNSADFNDLELERLQQEAAGNIEFALNKMSEQEKQLSSMKAEAGNKLKETKEQKTAVKAYSGENMQKRADGFFFDKKN